MRTLYTLAYPTLHEADLRFIETFRREHDLRYRDVVAAHFTLVFGCDAVNEAEYLERNLRASTAAERRRATMFPKRRSEPMPNSHVRRSRYAACGAGSGSSVGNLEGRGMRRVASKAARPDMWMCLFIGANLP
jgi:hypothetical protein